MITDRIASCKMLLSAVRLRGFLRSLAIENPHSNEIPLARVWDGTVVRTLCFKLPLLQRRKTARRTVLTVN